MGYKYVIWGSSNDFYLQSYKDVFNKENIEYLNGKIQTKSKFLNFIYTHHFGERINKIIKLPFKSVWNPLYFKNKFRKSDKICFILFCPPLLNKEYKIVKYLRKKYKDCKIVIFMQDLVSKSFIKMETIENFNNTVDLVLSFDHKDCETYGWKYYPLVYSPVEVPNDENIKESDLYFVGKAKDRLDDIIHIYKKCIDNGLVCDFHITGVPKDKQLYADKIDYCNYVPYEENLKRIKKTHCMLEVMQGGGHGYTLRYCEAIALGKRLITNNQEVINAPFYNKNYISTFSGAEDFDVSFIKHSEGDIDYNYLKELSPIKMIEYIDNYFKQNL